ncbi:conserved hypothetical protein [Vibrio nigripulchritudo MADA3029]|uniref:hypothetical protein n=1 Tax=Vibrio nigripulchritudo TaxID=28173 RepID=UPI00021C34C1|nr:hypothetical protein [Vibrio nigripulchritudo]EGU58408.1 hypothetical protein VINI7043_23997 [Vibrio nigripulchritudo ATCC 27043]CCN49612.1 conserved hypothetical protein [Vibrio nigripulchritudo MADA3020]CCN53654.1 conserved hypothetical protein [Vibrio nigripulchritudo MADA3021]CCN58487.1 conserved hypothetical protein [Vibrio nigripulchritudo MADA3029]
MKLKLSLLPLIFTIGSFSTFAADNEKNIIEKKVMDWMHVEVKSVKGIAIRHVFSCSFYSATPVLKHRDGESSFGDYKFYSLNGQLEELMTPTSTQVMPDVSECLKSDFRLNTQEDAEYLLEALDTLFASGSHFDQGVEKKAIKGKDGWKLITGEFFDDLSGYKVVTDEKGKIKKIEYVLGL